MDNSKDSKEVKQDSSKVCPYCGSKLTSTGQCLDLLCPSNNIHEDEHL